MAADLNTFTTTLNTKGGLANKMLTDTVLFASLQSSADELQRVSRTAALLTENLNKASSNLNNASAKLNQTDNPIGVVLNDQPTAEQMKQIMRNLESSTYNLNEDLKALQNNFLFRGYFRKKAKEQAGK